MKNYVVFLILTCIMTVACASNTPEKIVLEKPNLERGFSMMETFSKRKSVREFNEKELSKEDLSDLLWAANGINREDGKRTAPSAMNKQEIDTYAFFKAGVYKYDHVNHALDLVVEGDKRDLLSGGQDFVATAPLVLLYVGDASKFAKAGDEKSKMLISMDAGIVTQNVNLFCASVGLVTVTRGWMDAEALSALLKLPETQIPLLNNVIGYQK